MDNPTDGILSAVTPSVPCLLLIINRPRIPLITKILITHHRLFEQSKQIIFLWTPGHTGIRGNELADEAARQATESTITDVPLSLDDAKAALKKYAEGLEELARLKEVTLMLFPGITGIPSNGEADKQARFGIRAQFVVPDHVKGLS
nr:unnamed protein product [Callosobruchus analis]